MSRLRRRLFWSIGLIAVLAVMGGSLFWWFFDGPGSSAGMYERYEPLYKPKVEQLSRLGVAVDAEPVIEADELRPGLVPPFKPLDNCQLTNYWEVRRPLRYQVETAVDIRSTSSLVSNAWFYSAGHLRHQRWSGPPSEYTQKSLDGGLAEIYLVVIRQWIYKPHEEVAVLEGFVFDLRTDERVGRLMVMAEVPRDMILPTPLGSVKPDETARQVSAREWLGEEAKRRFINRLARMGAGQPD